MKIINNQAVKDIVNDKNIDFIYLDFEKVNLKEIISYKDNIKECKKESIVFRILYYVNYLILRIKYKINHT
jgi:hypothetical protein